MKELKVGALIGVVRDDYPDVESGEGIESVSSPHAGILVVATVESGEGIERHQPLPSPDEPLPKWNPVKELKGNGMPSNSYSIACGIR